MIAPRVVDEIRRLLAEGKLSQRKIAELTGVSRGTVGAIATGKRPDYPAPRRTSGDEQFAEPAGPPQRCPGCGGMVYMPCRLCRVRSQMARSPKPPVSGRPGEDDGPLQLELTGAHRKRYEKVHLERISAGAPSPRIEPQPAELSAAFEFDDDECEYDAAEFDRLSRADLWDALEFDDEEPLIGLYDHLGAGSCG